METNKVKTFTGYCVNWPPERSGQADVGIVFCNELNEEIRVRRNQLKLVGEFLRLYKGEKVYLEDVIDESGVLYGIAVRPQAIYDFFAVADEIRGIANKSRELGENDPTKTETVSKLRELLAVLLDLYKNQIHTNRFEGFPRIKYLYEKVKNTLAWFKIRVPGEKPKKQPTTTPRVFVATAEPGPVKITNDNVVWLIRKAVGSSAIGKPKVSQLRRSFLGLAKLHKAHMTNTFYDLIVGLRNFMRDVKTNNPQKLTVVECEKLANEIDTWLGTHKAWVLSQEQSTEIE